VSRRKYSYAGLPKLRKTLQRLEPDAVKDIKTVFYQGAEAIWMDAVNNLQSKLSGDGYGDLLASVTIKYGRDGMTAVIGPGAKTVTINKSPWNTRLYVKDSQKHEAWQFFKGYWFEFGTKGYPEHNIPPQPARPFMNPAYDTNKGRITKGVQKAVHDALISLASGPDNG
jgi:hypothetical protein